MDIKNVQPCLDLLQGLGVVIASGVAIYGIGAWRREHAGRRRYELAEEVLALFYEARDKIAFIRCNLSWSGEGTSRKAGPNETPEQKEALDRAYVVFERYQGCQETFYRLRALRYRFMALFGTSTAEPFDALDRVLREIFSSARMLSDLWGRHALTENQSEHIRKYESVFWEGSTGEDALVPKVNKAVEDMEALCRPIIQAAVSKKWCFWKS